MSTFFKCSFSTCLCLSLRQPVCLCRLTTACWLFFCISIAGGFYGILRIQSRSILISSSYADVSLGVSIDTSGDTPWQGVSWWHCHGNNPGYLKCKWSQICRRPDVWTWSEVCDNCTGEPACWRILIGWFKWGHVCALSRSRYSRFVSLSQDEDQRGVMWQFLSVFGTFPRDHEVRMCLGEDT